jgi:hypothetical protein
MWHFIEHSRELLINTLDLLSFFLVTPELIRFARPEAGRFFLGMTVMISALFIFVGAVGGSLLIVYLLQDIGSEIIVIASIIWYLICIFAFTALVFVLDYSEFLNRIISKGPSSRHLFVCGVVLFLASRLFAVIAAATELFHFEAMIWHNILVLIILFVCGVLGVIGMTLTLFASDYIKKKGKDNQALVIMIIGFISSIAIASAFGGVIMPILPESHMPDNLWSGLVSVGCLSLGSIMPMVIFYFGSSKGTAASDH